MSEQSNPNQRLNIDGASIEGSQIGQAGRDLIQTVTVYESLSFAGLFRREVKPPTQQEYRFRQKLLNEVKEFWVENVLERSLHNKAIIELGLEERPDLVERPFSNVQISPDESKQSLSIHRGITTAFNRMGEGRTLLILGEPGAGKTTVLLKLTRDLIARTSDNLNQPIPVVFNLSSWAKKQQKIADWLVDELQSNYGVSKSLGKAWVKDQQLLLLLDGLDEVRAKHREACVEAINEFMQNYGLTEMVVCSRIKDYQALSNRLQVRGAICVQPLTSKHINQYLDEAGEQLQGVKTLLQQDTAMQEMMKSPLTLSIVSMAYKDISVENLQQFGSIEERRRHLFETYIEQMFQRHGRAMRMKYTPEKTKHWIGWLATRMVQESQTVFLIEKIQPSWLEIKAERIFYRITSGLTSGVIFAVIVGLIFGPIYKQISGGYYGSSSAPILGKLLGAIPGLILGLIVGLYEGEIKTVESLKWSGKEFQNSLKKGLILGGLGWVTFGVIFQPIGGLCYGLSSGLLYCINQGVKGAEVENKKVSNQGIKTSVFNALIIGSIGMVMGGAVGFLASQFFYYVEDSFWICLGGFCLVLGLIIGGWNACIKHLTLRSMLYKKGVAPWNYARFLDYATELIFLQKVGGGYIFIHRMLLEHFAQVEPEQVPESSVKVSQSIDLINAVNSEELETLKTVKALEPESVSNKICGNCQHENLPHFNFCSKCGTALNYDLISN
ncbi:NACHT domain-containing protein [Lyngbya sp. PCC 8106]|uniref:NACHT domain-containing protein n=1 Tax=Lyngbya sp. (strain PCC 8106) TaxID=313612 RepID=UPI0000EA8FF0|nr:NACHT domain-containing protein [Lyngbya sp. PCC 8106]EAW35262.1 hypothetical protein L8106_16034 [Lyngbya sp. PCC 8106]